MAICDLHTGTKRLQLANRALKEKWADTREHWADQTAQQYQEQFLEPMGERIHLTLMAVQRLSETLHQAEVELGDTKRQVE